MGNSGVYPPAQGKGKDPFCNPLPRTQRTGGDIPEGKELAHIGEGGGEQGNFPQETVPGGSCPQFRYPCCPYGRYAAGCNRFCPKDPEYAGEER